MRQFILLCMIGGIACGAYFLSQKQTRLREAESSSPAQVSKTNSLKPPEDQPAVSSDSGAAEASPALTPPASTLATGEHPMASKFKQADVRQRIGLLNTLKADTSPAALDMLLLASADEHADVRRRAMRLLADRKEPEALDRLLAAARSEDADDREAAFIALSAVDRHRVDAALVMRGLNDPKHEVRAAASHAAGQLYIWRAMPQLVANLNHVDRSVRTVSIRSVNRLCGVQFRYDPEIDAAGRRSQVDEIQKKWRSYEVYHKDFMRRLEKRGA